mmetsp:Transcript_11324/g.18735  ORF Transcript_11324/g.18735 Transcript_11324/m.18735 type:complete len:260 (+) Transcript_11324:458-1237(+)
MASNFFSESFTSGVDVVGVLVVLTAAVTTAAVGVSHERAISAMLCAAGSFADDDASLFFDVAAMEGCLVGLLRLLEDAPMDDALTISFALDESLELFVGLLLDVMVDAFMISSAPFIISSLLGFGLLSISSSWVAVSLLVVLINSSCCGSLTVLFFGGGIPPESPPKLISMGIPSLFFFMGATATGATRLLEAVVALLLISSESPLFAILIMLSSISSISAKMLRIMAPFSSSGASSSSIADEAEALNSCLFLEGDTSS